jgi:hypothetical protein
LNRCQLATFAHAEQRVEVWRRQGADQWALHSSGPTDSIRILSLDCELPVESIHRDPLA